MVIDMTTVYLKGIINTTFEFIDVNLVEDIDDENIIQFSKGDNIIKTVGNLVAEYKFILTNIKINDIMVL